MANPSYSSHHGAIAYYTTNFAIKLFFNMYVKINKPKIPIKLFSKKEEALNWLTNLMLLKKE